LSYGRRLLIGATWLSDNGFATLFQAVVVGGNDTAITTDSHPIFNGSGATMEIINPGWGAFSQSYDPAGGAIGLGAFGTASAVILGNSGRTLLNEHEACRLAGFAFFIPFPKQLQ